MAINPSLAKRGTAVVGALGSLISLGFALNDAVKGIEQNSNPIPTNYYTQNTAWQFPYDLPNIGNPPQTFCILFNFYKYQRPSILSPPSLSPYGSIALPIPNDLLDISDLSYSPQGTNLMFGTALESFAGGGISGAAQDVANILAGHGNQVAQNLVGKAKGDSNAVQKAYQMVGLAQNPFLTVLFNAPSFKRHIFSWQFIPETPQDSEVLKYIINKFRYHSLPDVVNNTGGLLLTYPDMCIPQIIPQGYMYDFKHCVVEGMSINLAPGDTPAFFAQKNAPSAVKFTVKLLEIEYWLKSDLLATPGSGVTNPNGFTYNS